MAFTYQKNHDIRFLRNEAFLDKAEENLPRLTVRENRPAAVVGLAEAPGLLGGWGVAPDPAAEAAMAGGMGKGDSAILDFGAPLVGKFGISIASVGSPMDAPLTLKLRFAELPFELAMDSGSYDGWLSSSWIQEEVIHLDKLPFRLELPRRYSFRYVELRVLDTSPKWKAVFTDALALAESSADRNRLALEPTGDPQLDRICAVAVRTLENCMQEVFEDGPKRDRRLWLGDLRLQALADYASFDQKELVRRCLYLFAAVPAEDGRIPAAVFTAGEVIPDDTFLLDYGLFYVSVLHDYLERHWEEALLRDLYPVAKRQMDRALLSLDGEGRFHAGEAGNPFLDWGWKYSTDAPMQGVLVYTLRHFLALAERMEDPEAPAYRRRLDAATAYAVQKLYDPEAGLFVSGPERELSLASQVWMALAHVLPETENRRLMERTAERFAPYRQAKTPYMMHHVAHALLEAGLGKQAVKLIRDYWGGMIALGADTFWEAYDPDQPDFSPYGSPIVSSFCHAWSCTPVWLIQKYRDQILSCSSP